MVVGVVSKLVAGCCFTSGWLPFVFELVECTILVALSLNPWHFSWVIFALPAIILSSVLLVRTLLVKWVEFSLQAVTSKCEQSACNSLLAKLCDATAELDDNLCFTEHSQTLSSLLLHEGPVRRSMAGTQFSQLVSSDEERDHLVARFCTALASRDSDENSLFTNTTNTQLRDALNNSIAVEVLHVAFSDAYERPRFLLGIRERERERGPPVAPLPLPHDHKQYVIEEEPSSKQQLTSEEVPTEAPLMVIDCLVGAISCANAALKSLAGQNLTGELAEDFFASFEEGSAIRDHLSQYDAEGWESPIIKQFDAHFFGLTVFEVNKLEAWAVLDLTKFDRVPGLWKRIRGSVQGIERNIPHEVKKRKKAAKRKKQRAARAADSDRGSDVDSDPGAGTDSDNSNASSRRSRSSSGSAGSKTNRGESGHLSNLRRHTLAI
eukprot:TRINITY_DN10276_c0_g1_i1.p1 TRINITY_DN10276_c0_g1~~TRINITY_DN10276_c0_g1_i1.p1  ORF type:complete len:445 (-),score=54.72 TRINITY_DN10276_c0_g1_i1:110-1417(-)